MNPRTILLVALLFIIILPSIVAETDSTAPGRITNVALADTPGDNGGSLTLTWTVSDASDFGMYRIYLSTSRMTDPDEEDLIKEIDDINVTMYNITAITRGSLEDGKEYYAGVLAVDLSGNVGPMGSSDKASPEDDTGPELLYYHPNRNDLKLEAGSEQRFNVTVDFHGDDSQAIEWYLDGDLKGGASSVRFDWDVPEEIGETHTVNVKLDDGTTIVDHTWDIEIVGGGQGDVGDDDEDDDDTSDDDGYDDDVEDDDTGDDDESDDDEGDDDTSDDDGCDDDVEVDDTGDDDGYDDDSDPNYDDDDYVDYRGDSGDSDKGGTNNSYIWIGVLIILILLISIIIVIILILYFQKEKKNDYMNARITPIKPRVNINGIKKLDCFVHRTNAIGVCVNCGKGICEHCAVEIKNKLHCKDCVKEIIEGPSGATNRTNKKRANAHGNMQLAKSQGRTSVLFSIAGFILGPIFGIRAIIYGTKAYRNSKGRYGMGGIAFGILSIIFYIIIVITMILVFAI